ncbi:MAG: helix-turn-helix transcriptional regulator [Fusicatenibacter sp.]|nr:helix-turn-helix transcriptional regulator [Lachnospiraceae bacterium]MDY2938423.1 helix-turn-helix transcriptional regulator [Fusicatenibacter sp.]
MSSFSSSISSFTSAVPVNIKHPLSQMMYSPSYLRNENRLTQEALAEKCHVSRQAIAKWENGDSVPGLDKLCFLAELYNVSLDELVGKKAIDKYSRLLNLVKENIVTDIPINENDEISAIVSRYLMFVQSVDLSAEDKLRGLQEIFLKENISK